MDRRLGGPLPRQQANPPRTHPRPEAEATFSHVPRRDVGPSGINPSFLGLFRCRGQVIHVLLTRSPLSPGPKSWFSLDLHVLGAPPAFVLSQDQTLHQDLDRTAGYPRGWSSIGELLRNLTEVEEQLNELTEPPFRTKWSARTASLAFGVHCSVFKKQVPDIRRGDTCSHPGPGPEGRANPHG